LTSAIRNLTRVKVTIAGNERLAAC